MILGGDLGVGSVTNLEQSLTTYRAVISGGSQGDAPEQTPAGTPSLRRQKPSCWVTSEQSLYRWCQKSLITALGEALSRPNPRKTSKSADFFSFLMLKNPATIQMGTHLYPSGDEWISGRGGTMPEAAYGPT